MSTVSQEESALARRVASVERRSAAMERAIIAAMQEVDELRCVLTARMDDVQRVAAAAAQEGRRPAPESGSNDEDGSDGGTPRAGPTLRVLKEAMHAAAEASAASAALREKLRLQQLRQGGLEQEVEALRSGLERRVQGLEQHTSQRACEVEGRLRGVEAAAQRPDSGGDALLLQQLQARVARLERRQEAMQGHAVT
ncbi:putative plectin-like protein, partial [Trypanosoma conorhini]